MDCAEIDVDASPEVVWATLADAKTFEYWVVGCKDVRFVEGDWPELGASIHHRVGIGPATIDDTTSVIESTTERHLALRARARPVGVARVDIELQPCDGNRTTVVMRERVVEGPMTRVPDRLHGLLLHGRNLESLRRLRMLAEGRTPSE
jgi:uncharacterized protein YndB with AHSA1/START domain